MAKTKLLSVVMPCYNEKDTIEKIIDEVQAVNLGTTKKEVVIVDDCSKDGTRDILKKLAKKHDNITLIFQDANQGKGAALKKGLLATKGDVVVIQDADLEYDPQDYKRLLYPIERGHADVVYGSRFIGGEPHRIIYHSNKIANKVLTKFSNLLTGLSLTDVETCYKMFRGDLVRGLAKHLQAKRFGFEPEITARIARSKAPVYEIGISYYGRSKEEGKKIGVRDGIKTVWEIIYFNATVRNDQEKTK
jgi:glycosyltransferase involved in cell wall biosynthesis